MVWSSTSIMREKHLIPGERSGTASCISPDAPGHARVRQPAQLWIFDSLTQLGSLHQSNNAPDTVPPRLSQYYDLCSLHKTRILCTSSVGDKRQGDLFVCWLRGALLPDRYRNMYSIPRTTYGGGALMLHHARSKAPFQMDLYVTVADVPAVHGRLAHER